MGLGLAVQKGPSDAALVPRFRPWSLAVDAGRGHLGDQSLEDVVHDIADELLLRQPSQHGVRL